MSALLKRMQKNSVVKKASAMHESEILLNQKCINLPVPIMNVAYSGRLDGGIKPGLHMVAGPSKHFKSNLCLVAVKAFLDQYSDGVVLFYDSEFGSLPSYWEVAGIDTSRVLHLPIMNMEELKFDIMKKLEDIQDGENVFIYVDSLGNLASVKEIADALEESGAADMTRAKAGKSTSRMITPYLTMKNIWMMAIQHTYDCGTEKMLVKTPDRGNVSLKDLKVGDLVCTENGTENVSYVVSYDNTPISEIELEDGTILEFTAGHRFKVNGEWKYVDDLEIGDILDTLE